MCTTVPPAKSRTPSLNRNPSGCHVQCANGAYIKSENKTKKIMYDLNFTLSAKVPVINAGVMIANFNWKNANSTNGIVGASDQGFPSSTFWNMKNDAGFPMKPFQDSPKARLKPTTI